MINLFKSGTTLSSGTIRRKRTRKRNYHQKEKNVN